MQTAEKTSPDSKIDATVLLGFKRIENCALADGAEAELLVTRDESLKLNSNDGRIEKFESSNSQAGGVRVILNGVEGYCWTESLGEDDLEMAYREALANAKFAARGHAIKDNERVELC